MKLAPIIAAALVTAAAGGGADDKPYQMFMGTDIDLDLGGRLCRVEGVHSAAFVVNDHGRPVEVPMTKAGALRVVPSLKIVPTLATVDKLVVERAYSPGNDPRRRMMEQSAALAAEEDNAELAQGRLSASETNGLPLVSSGAGPGGKGGVVGTEIGKNQMATIQGASGPESAGLESGSDLGQIGTTAGKIQQQLQEEQFDAMHIAFAVSSARMLTQPYLVAMVHYMDPGKGRRTAHWWIYAQELSAIEPRAHRVEILAPGLPPGFTYDRTQIHLYDHGSEVATTASANWISLSEEEAFLYLIADYLSTNRGATLAPAPVLHAPTRAEAAVLMRAGSPRYVFVTVDKDGNATGAFTDAKCAHPVPEGLVSVTLLKVRFTPALEAGRPALGVARLDLGL